MPWRFKYIAGGAVASPWLITFLIQVYSEGCQVLGWFMAPCARVNCSDSQFRMFISFWDLLLHQQR